MRLFLLGCPRLEHLNRWKNYIEEDAIEIGWDVVHVPAKGPTVEDVLLEVKKFEPDIFMWSRTPRHNPIGNYGDMLRRIEDSGIVTVSHHMDLYFGVGPRCAQIGVDPWWSSQYVCTADGGHQKEFKEKGVNHIWCPPAIGSRVANNPEPRNKSKKGEVIFVGGYWAVAHKTHRKQLLMWASRRYDGNFKHYRNIWGQDLGKLYASDIAYVLGDSAISPNGYYWSDRIVNTLGRRGILSHPYVRGLNICRFTDETMIKYKWFDFESIHNRFVQMSAKEIEEMRDAGWTVVKERHTFKNRLLDLQKQIGLA